jgi:hypothetical protein
MGLAREGAGHFWCRPLLVAAPATARARNGGGPALFARQIVLQIALQDIGQLTDI